MNHEAIYALYPVVVSVDGQGVAWDANGSAVAYDIAALNAWIDPNAYKAKRQAEYPPFTDYLDGIVKSDAAQVQKYIADCLAVKARFPK